MLILGRDRRATRPSATRRRSCASSRRRSAPRSRTGVTIVANAGGLNPAGLADAVRALAERSGSTSRRARRGRRPARARRRARPRRTARRQRLPRRVGHRRVPARGRRTSSSPDGSPTPRWSSGRRSRTSAGRRPTTTRWPAPSWPGTSSSAARRPPAATTRSSPRSPTRAIPASRSPRCTPTARRSSPSTPAPAARSPSARSPRSCSTRSAARATPARTSPPASTRSSCTPDGADRVRIAGVRGEPPPPTLKVGLNTLGGFRNEMTFVLTGLDIEAKADLVRPQLADLDATWTLARTDHPDADVQEEAAALLHCVVRGPDPKALGRAFSGAAIELALASYPGFHVTAPPGDASPYGVFTAAYVEAALVPHVAVLPTARASTSRRRRSHASSSRSPRRRRPSRADRPDRGACRSARSSARAAATRAARPTSGVWVRTDDAVRLAGDMLTVEQAPASCCPRRRALPVTRHVLPNLRALNFVVEACSARASRRTRGTTRRPRRSASGCARASSTSRRRCCD